VPFPLVKTEPASGDCPLQGLLNCVKEIPEALGRHPSSGSEDPWLLQEDPGVWKRNSGGKGHSLGWEGPDVTCLVQGCQWPFIAKLTGSTSLCQLEEPDVDYME
jgi:hypothetical protein